MNTSDHLHQPNIVAVIFDWAGTIVDHGSRAPVTVFQRIFQQYGIAVSVAQAREPMGKAKREHIATISKMPSIDAAWNAKFGHSITESEIDKLYGEFLPLQKQVIRDHRDVIQGAPETFAFLRSMGIRIGSTTGYTHALMEEIVPFARESGILPDTIVCADDVAAGRPKPWLIFEALERLDRYPSWKAVVVDDTTVGIQAGLAAGCWTVAVSKSGNELGMSADEVAARDPSSLQSQLEGIEHTFQAIGADFVIETVSDLPRIVMQIDASISRGEMPRGIRRSQMQ